MPGYALHACMHSGQQHFKYLLHKQLQLQSTGVGSVMHHPSAFINAMEADVTPVYTCMARPPAIPQDKVKEPYIYHTLSMMIAAAQLPPPAIPENPHNTSTKTTYLSPRPHAQLWLQSLHFLQDIVHRSICHAYSALQSICCPSAF